MFTSKFKCYQSQISSSCLCLIIIYIRIQRHLYSVIHSDLIMYLCDVTLYHLLKPHLLTCSSSRTMSVLTTRWQCCLCCSLNQNRQDISRLVLCDEVHTHQNNLVDPPCWCFLFPLSTACSFTDGKSLYYYLI